MLLEESTSLTLAPCLGGSLRVWHLASPWIVKSVSRYLSRTTRISRLRPWSVIKQRLITQRVNTMLMKTTLIVSLLARDARNSSVQVAHGKPKTCTYPPTQTIIKLHVKLTASPVVLREQARGMILVSCRIRAITGARQVTIKRTCRHLHMRRTIS